MKVELHLHTSRYSGCAANSPEEMMARLVATGYEAVFITEHDAVWPAGEIAELRKAFPAIGIFPGLEINIGQAWSMEHLLVLGTNDAGYLRLSGPEEILAKARSEGHLTVLAHPCRWEGSGKMIGAALLPDALEARTGNQDACRAGLAEKLAGSLNLPAVNAGDAHSVNMIDQFWIETARPIAAPDDVRRIVLARAYVNCINQRLRQ